MAQDAIRHGRFAVIDKQRIQAFIKQKDGCFIWCTLIMLFRTRYEEYSALLARLFRGDKVKKLKIKDFKLDKLGRRVWLSKTIRKMT